ncbi:MAG TPA: DUF3240 family protein [Burkholderiales bacterium]|nr:DUF3240 family protein [Burkholderiales bacterium]
MSDASCLLTLVFPPSLEETVIGQLLEHPKWGSRFICFRADGHGQAMPLSGSAELVRGRTPRLIVQLIVARAEVQALLADMRRSVASPEVAYWMVELADSGRLA